MKRPLCVFCMGVSLVSCIISPFLKNRIKTYEEYEGRSITLTGTVCDLERRDSEYGKSLDVCIKDIRVEGTLPGIRGSGFKGPGKVIAYYSPGSGFAYSTDESDPYGNIRMGQRIRVKGTIKPFSKATNEGMFDSLVYYRSLGVSFGIKNVRIPDRGKRYDILRDGLYRLRLRASDILTETLGDEESSVMKAMLLGSKKAVDEDLKALYRRNGIAHILCISGLHISLLGMGLFKILKRTPAGIKAAAVISFSVIFMYVLMTGICASSLRALGMFAFSMGAVLIGRTADMMTDVSFFCAVLLISNPLYIYNAGFVFSFGCVIGIAVLMPTLSSERVSENGHALSKPLRAVLSSLTMTVISLPIYLFFYFQFPVYSFLLNFLVIPVMGILVSAGFLLIVLYPLTGTLSSPVGVLITGILDLFRILSERADKLPFHFYTPGKPYLWQIILYVSILALLYLYRQKTTLRLRWLVTLAAAFMLTLRFDPGCTLDFLDVGQGDGMFLRYRRLPVAAGGYSGDLTCLIDGGSSSVNKVGKYRIIPYLKSRGCDEVDMVILSHLDSDHTSGIKELLSDGPLEGIRVKTVYVPYPAADHDRGKYEEIAKLCKAAGTELVGLSEGDIILPDGKAKIVENENRLFDKKKDDLKIRVESPFNDVVYNDPNEMSVVLSLYCNGQSVILTGDIGNEAEKILTERMNVETPYTLLKCAHHGSRTSSCGEFLDKVRPAVTVISVGKGNSYGLPADETLKRFTERNIKILRTDESGMIRARIRKNGISVRTPFSD
ncbi:MAG: DNA internalization-related competence protein ComEC/Rec2 [Lachnospiraceae bacterium]|nr:DNA internalization-related competence protein ComEC/Rec2 [Lachnospiraceae bacterium]